MMDEAQRPLFLIPAPIVFPSSHPVERGEEEEGRLSRENRKQHRGSDRVFWDRIRREIVYGS
jgi:hypothetical protein